MKKNNLLSFFAILTAMASCVDEDVASSRHESNDVYADIKTVITDFISSTRSGFSEEDLEIESVSTRYYDEAGDEIYPELSTRAASSEAFPLSTVVFKKDDQEGYCLLSEDSRLREVYFFTENGSVSDTVFIEPLKEYIETVPKIAAADLDASISSGPVLARDIPPLVKVKWGQGYPFNIVAPYCNGVYCSTDEFQYHNPVGCGSIALAALFATTKYIGRYSDIDLNNLPVANDSVRTDQLDNIRRFMSQISSACRVTFGCNCNSPYPQGSGITQNGFQSMNQFLIGLGYNTDYKARQALDVNKLYTELKLGIPHIIGGYEPPTQISGHVWLIDGLRDSTKGVMFHCVWGWYGKSDGWTRENYYTGGGYSFSKQQMHIYVTAKPVGSWETMI